MRLGAKAMVVVGAGGEFDYCRYVKNLCETWLNQGGEVLFEQLCNIKNTIVRNLVRGKMVTVHAERGHTPFYNLNVSLAYDYRIAAEGTIYENQSAAYGMVAMGGGGYFLPRILGTLKAARLARQDTLSAAQALELGLIDEIVPEHALLDRAMAIAKAGLEDLELVCEVRKLYKVNLDELTRSLHLEDEIVRARFMDKVFRQSVIDAAF